MFEWPPNWSLFFAIVAFLAASTAVRGWKNLGAMLVLSVLLTFPIKWIGPLLGLPELGEDALTITYEDKPKISLDASNAWIGGVILASLAIIAWKKATGRRLDQSN